MAASKAKKVGIPLAILTVIAGIAGGSYAITIDQSTNTTIGDITTNIINQAMQDKDIQEVVREYGLDTICNLDPIPTGFFAICVDREQ